MEPTPRHLCDCFYVFLGTAAYKHVIRVACQALSLQKESSMLHTFKVTFLSSNSQLLSSSLVSYPCVYYHMYSETSSSLATEHV